MKKLFSSESVTEGHPDKICDQISDAVLDTILALDPNARVACETTVTTGLCLVAGEITTTAYVDIQKIVRNVVKEIGYDKGKYGFDAENIAVLTAIDPQSPDIAQGVNDGQGLYEEQGAGDQGLMFGFATNETTGYIPTPIYYAHKLAKKLSDIRKDKTLPYLRPDGKTQVTVEYDEFDKVLRVDTIVISTQHSEDVEWETIDKDLRLHVIDKVIPKELLIDTRILINPTGKFVIGGPQGDCGLTGRKIIVDTYGGYSRHGGGAFSGKDATKVDRSAAYAARWIAKNIVAAGLADKCEIQLAYAIGFAEPVSIRVDTFNTGKVSDEIIVKAIMENFDLRPKGIIDSLDLRKPIFRQTAAYGHFGREDISLPWEMLNKIDVFKKYL